jgi:hypothetical protein
MYDPVNDEPRECANIKRNIRQLSERRASLSADMLSAQRLVEQRRREAEAARRDFDLAKQRAKPGKQRDRRPIGRPSKWEMAAQGTEVIEQFAKALLRDWTRRAREADQSLRQAESALTEIERRLNATQRLLDQSEQAFERFECRGTITSYRIWGRGPSQPHLLGGQVAHDLLGAAADCRGLRFVIDLESLY